MKIIIAYIAAIFAGLLYVAGLSLLFTVVMSDVLDIKNRTNQLCNGKKDNIISSDIFLEVTITPNINDLGGYYKCLEEEK